MSPTASWESFLETERQKDYFLSITTFLAEERSLGKVVCPPEEEIFHAFSTTPLSKVRVVILGQDPYHGPNQAHGLSFSVKRGVPLPPSLRNIFQELSNDLGVSGATHGCLNAWAEQGVLLLNAVLSVELGKPQSHAKIGWQTFTDAALSVLNDECKDLIFLLWGAYAQKKKVLIDTDKHTVLSSSHPSPLSAYRGFLGCGHFSKVNEILCERGEPEINWRV